MTDKLNLRSKDAWVSSHHDETPPGEPARNDDLHDCPKVGCGARIPFEVMACKPHWFSLPPDLRRRVWVAWRRGGIDGVLDARREVEAVLNG